jgi:hypothetical protein
MAKITSITGIQNCTNLQDFRADYNALTSIDLSGLSSLTYVDVSDQDAVDNDNSLTSINLSGCTSLEELYLDDNDFSAGLPDLSNCTSLTDLDIDESSIVGSVDLSFLPSLEYIDLQDNPDLTEVIISSTQPLNDLNFNDCGLTQTAIDNILITLASGSVESGYVDLVGEDNSYPSSAGLDAIDILDGRSWEWHVNEAPPAYVGIAASTDFDIEGDFTIEMFVNMDNTDDFPRPYSFGTYPAANAISLESGDLYFWANNASLMAGTFIPTTGSWNHIAVMGSGSNAYLFADGVQIATAAYTGSISSQNLPLTIGYGNEPQSGFNGKMSNFRWTNAALYPTASFTVPTAPLTASEDTVLLTFQGTTLNAQLLDNSGNEHNATANGATYSALNPFTGVSGSLQMGTI